VRNAAVNDKERKRMYAVPSSAEVTAVAKSLGIHLGPDEADLYRTYLLEQLNALDTFVQSRI
jgi:hypothetical protein